MKTLGLISIAACLLSCGTLSPDGRNRPSRTLATKGTFSAFQESVERLEKELEVEPTHESQFLLHKDDSGTIQQTDTVVVVLHGLSLSPQWMKQVSNIFHKLGHNVINLRLANHFETPRKNLDNVRYQDWLRQVDDLLPHLESVGKKAIFVGHSTGALMAMYGLANNSIPTEQLILLSPALKLTLSLQAGAAMARFLGVSGAFTDTIKKKLTIKPKKYDSTFAEVQVRNLSKSVLEDTLGYDSRTKTFGSAQIDQLIRETPTLVIDTEGDLIVNVHNNQVFFSPLRKTQYQRILRKNNVAHNRIMFLRKGKQEQETLTYRILSEFLFQEKN